MSKATPKVDPLEEIIAATERRPGAPQKMPGILAALSARSRQRVEELMDMPRRQFSHQRIADVITLLLQHEGVDDSVSEGTVKKYRGMRGI